MRNFVGRTFQSVICPLRRIGKSVLLFLMACNQPPTAPSGGLLVTDFHPAVLQETPGKKGTTIRELQPGERVADLEETSDFLTQMQVGDSVFQSPWLRVRTPDGATGWVFGPAVKPVDGDYEAWFLRKKMDCFLGKQLARQLPSWANAMENAETDEAFAGAFRDGLALRGRVAAVLAAHRERNEAAFVPDYFWLNEAMPGFIVQISEDGLRPNLFADYAHFQALAAKTDGEQDDVFVQTCLAAFPLDSIESASPVWQIQTDAGNFSQLGTGQHLKMVATIGRALRDCPFFEPELSAIKDELMTDIMHHKTAFWQSKELIVKELTEILGLKFSCLTERDRLALTERLRVLRDAEANGVRVNVRAGE